MVAHVYEALTVCAQASQNTHLGAIVSLLLMSIVRVLKWAMVPVGEYTLAGA